MNISQELLSGGDSEMLEDLLIAVFNRFIEEATKVEASEAENIMKDMLPPDFSNMFK
ncbi:MAG: YbaB/EbfC family nucleoid-associated protein [Saprospiraceae bacterium]|nr:YbaB/EbfC family nucleoid-associated protein [Saprospiraceae bacterium]